MKSVLINFRSDEQRSEAYLNIAPSGLVPTLIDETHGAMSQSLAILMYLEDRFPQPSLLPDDKWLFYKAWEMALVVACDIHPLNNLRILKYLTGELGASEEQKNAWYAHWIQLGFEGLEAMVDQLGGAYCVGDTVTIPDICLVPQMFNARRFDVDLSPFPKLVAIDQRLRELPAFEQAAPE